MKTVKNSSGKPTAILKAATVPSSTVVAVALPEALELLASQVAGALQETQSLSETLGALTRAAGAAIKKNADLVDPFVDACKQMCGAVGLTEGSVKVYLSNIRGVLRAMAGGWVAPKGDMTLRAMYEAAPKGTGRQKAQKTGARPNDGVKAVAGDADEEGDDGADSATPAAAAKPVDPKHAAMVALFGHADDELAAALQWAAQHEMRFLNLIKAQIAFDSKPAKREVAQLKAA
jgi:hypothetical protein